MITKKYLLLDVGESRYGAEELQLKIVNGFLRSEIMTALNVQRTWAPAGAEIDYQKNNRLYFLPGCTVPRFKVRDSFSSVLKPSKATAIFLNKNSLEGSEHTFEHHDGVFPIEEDDMPAFLPWLEDLKQTNIATLFKSITSGSMPIEGIYIGRGLWSDNAREQGFTNGGMSINEVMELMGTSTYSHGGMSQGNQYQMFVPIKDGPLTKATCDFYLEESLLKSLNQDAVIIDGVKYEEMRQFGLTGEHDNLVLLMELMANCNVQKSLANVLFLLQEFAPNFRPMAEAQHVNFKSLLTYLKFDKNVLRRGVHLEDLTKILMAAGDFTEDIQSRLSSVYSGHGEVDYDHSDNEMWIEGPVLKPEFRKLLNT